MNTRVFIPIKMIGLLGLLLLAPALGSAQNPAPVSNLDYCVVVDPASSNPDTTQYQLNYPLLDSNLNQITTTSLVRLKYTFTLPDTTSVDWIHLCVDHVPQGNGVLFLNIPIHGNNTNTNLSYTRNGLEVELLTAPMAYNEYYSTLVLEDDQGNQSTPVSPSEVQLVDL